MVMAEETTFTKDEIVVLMDSLDARIDMYKVDMLMHIGRLAYEGDIAGATQVSTRLKTERDAMLRLRRKLRALYSTASE